MPARTRAELSRSQFGSVQRLGASLMQRRFNKGIQFRTATGIIQNTFPFRIFGLVLEEAGKVHNFARLFFRQRIDDLYQRFGCRSHCDFLSLNPSRGKWSINSTTTQDRSG